MMKMMLLLVLDDDFDVADGQVVVDGRSTRAVHIIWDGFNSLSADDEDGAVVGDKYDAFVGEDDDANDADGEVVVDGRTRERCM